MNRIDLKIEELIIYAAEEHDNNLQIILHALRGARSSKMDGLLAAKIIEYTKDVLLPKIKELQSNKIANNN